MNDLIDATTTANEISNAATEMEHEILRLRDALEARDKHIEEFEAAVLDFFVHDKRETRAALRDLVGGFDGVDRHKQALGEKE